MNDPPTPPTPPDCDLRGLQFMPLYGDRLFASVTWISASPEAKVAALRLWWHAYAREIPAASLPDDDKMLAEYAGYGVAIKSWRRMKPAAMRGWLKCSDGRWYHPVVAELALEAWAGRERNREKQRRWRDRNLTDDGNVTVTLPSRNAGEGQGEGQLQGQGQKSKSKTARGRATPMPPDFRISERVRQWATEKGFDRLDEHLDAFRRKCAAKGYTYIDWDAAFMEAVREDWARLRGRRADSAAVGARSRAAVEAFIARGKDDAAH